MITSIIAGFLGLIYIIITVNVIKTRRRFQISLGDGGNLEMQKAVSAHSNFNNYTPLFLILLYLIEVNHFIPIPAITILGSLFTFGRILHFRGIIKENFKLRVPGMMLTIFPIVISSLINLVARFF
jgi:uncharacterized membrane protein YecN with MAPEG domain